MARIDASFSFDQDLLDLNALDRGALASGLEEDVNLVAVGHVFSDLYYVQWFGYVFDYLSVFLGRNFTVDSGDVLATGSVEGYVEMIWDGWEYVPTYEMSGFSIAASKILAAARTASTGDDQALMRTILAKDDQIFLSDQADRARGFDGDDMLAGRGGDDSLFGGNGNDSLDGHSGDDFLSGDSGNDVLWGGDGNDVLRGGSGYDTLNGGNGRDRIYLDSGNDRIDGGAGIDWVLASGSADVSIRLYTTDMQSTRLGRDTIRNVENAAGANGDDFLAGNDLANDLRGLRGDDRLDGHGGDDRLSGGDGADTLFGDNGQDRLNGGSGADLLIGGAGRDILTGGAGADVFAFRSMTHSTRKGYDAITDFEQGEDRIDLRSIDASNLVSGNNQFRFVGEDGIGTMRHGEVAIQHLDRAGSVNDRTVILIDIDDDRAPEAVIRLTGLHDLTAEDFLL